MAADADQSPWLERLRALADSFIIVVVIGARYVLRFSRLIFAEVEKGAIAFPFAVGDQIAETTGDVVETSMLLMTRLRTTKNVDAEPAPFVLQTGLDDFGVAYELDVHVRAVEHGPRIRPHLHRHIQDLFAETRIEIRSPHLTAVRDGGAPVLP
jgi:hypothetical protein